MPYRLPHGLLDLDAGLFLPDDADPVALTERELALCRWMAARQGQIISRRTLLVEVWGYAPSVSSRAVDYTIFRLRAKIEPVATAPVFLRTLYGQGYRLDLPRVVPDADRWRALIGELPVLSAALSEALAVLPEETVVLALKTRGVSALSASAHAAVCAARDALPEGARRLLEQLVAWVVLTPSVLESLSPTLADLARLQGGGLLIQQGGRLCVPLSIRRTLLDGLTGARRTTVLAEHAAWLERSLAARWEVWEDALLFDLPVPDMPEVFRAEMWAEAAALLDSGGVLAPRTARLLTCHMQSSIREALALSRRLQEQVTGQERWDMAAREARLLEIFGETAAAAAQWEGLAAEAEAGGWVHRALAARGHNLRLDPSHPPEAMEALMREADARGARSTSYFTRLWLALRAALPEAEAAAVEALQIARQQRSPHHETIALICIAGLQIRQEQPLQALPHLRRAIAISTDIGRTFQQAQARNILALCLAGTGSLPEALRCAQEAVALTQDIRSPGLGMTCWATLAALLHTDGQLDAAYGAFIEAESRAEGSPHSSLVCALKASVEAELGEIHGAEASLSRATHPAFAPFAVLAAEHTALSRGEGADVVRARLAEQPSDPLRGSPLQLDYRLARQRLERRLSRC